MTEEQTTLSGVTCTRCTCPQCERERFLLWTLVDILIFEAGQAQGVVTKAEKLKTAWRLYNPYKTKNPG